MSSISPLSIHGDATAGRSVPRLALIGQDATSARTPQERQYLVMRDAFERIGGLVTGTDAAHRLSRFCDQPVSRLARWIVERSIVNLEWRSCILVPMFQFEAASMTPRQAVLDVVQELKGDFDSWQTALWFAEPSPWLRGRLPLETVLQDPDAVREAARADRFLVHG